MKKSLPFLKWIIWALAAIFYFYEFVLRVSPSVMIPELMASFGITASSVGVLSAFYLYAYAPMQLPVGILMDRYGVKRMLSFASIICGGGALIFSSAHHLGMASFGRMLIGAGSAFAFVAMVYITSQWFPLKKRAFLIGIANSVAMLGASGGTGPLASVIRDFGWRATIGLFGAFGILLGLLVYLILRNHQEDHKTLHNAAERESDEKKATILENLKSVALQKNNWFNALAALLFYMTTTAFAGLWGLSFMQTAYGVSKEVAGYAMSMVFAGWLLGGPLTGFISDSMGRRKTTIRMGIIGALLALIPVIYFPTIPIYVIYALLFLVGLFSSAELLNFSLAMENGNIKAKATAAAFTNFLISCGDALIQPLVGFLLDFNWNGAMENGIRVYSAENYQVALSCLPIALIVAFFLLFFIKEEGSEKKVARA